MKRIVLCCDGTWNSVDQQTKDGQPTPTNVVRMAYRVAKSADVPQITHHDQGVGTGNWWDKIVGGALGEGLTANVLQAYRFLVLNYEPGDELFLFGFSRGAFTARSIGGMIRKCGIVRRDRVREYLSAVKLYSDKQHPDDDEPKAFRRDRSITGENEIPIKFVGVWDTVGALGIPKKDPNDMNRSDFEFADNELSGWVKNGYHALAVDERRAPFAPTLWTLPKDANGNFFSKPGQHIEQVWFPGVHSNVGGGYESRGLSDIALKWMLEKAQGCGLVIDTSSDAAYPLGPDPMVPMDDSMTWMYRAFMGGAYDRPIGLSRDPANLSKPPSIPDPTQSLHESVLERWDKNEKYRPASLKDYFKRIGDKRAE